MDMYDKQRITEDWKKDMGDKLTQSFHVFYKPKVEQDSIAYV
jgi:hypothetical protein